VPAPERLAGGAVVAGNVPDNGQQRRQQGPGEPVAGGGRQVGHRGRVVGQPAEVVRGQLVGPVRRLAELGHRRPALGRAEVGEMARRQGTARGIED
jgi:hypothetical protein